MRQRCTECTDISAGRKVVIDQFLNEEAKKDEAISDTLWSCVTQVQTNIGNKIRWCYEEKKQVGFVSQQLTQVGLGASSSSNAPTLIEQQQSPSFTGYVDETDNPFGLTATQLYEISIGEQTLKEFEAEQAKLQQECEEKVKKGRRRT